jgi:hypothetical protein
MKPGLRGKYCVQLPTSVLDINTVGIMMRTPWAIATRKASFAPGRIDTGEAVVGLLK